MGEQTTDDPPGWHNGNPIPGYDSGREPIQESESDDGDPTATGVPIDTDYIDAPSEPAEISQTDEIDPRIHRGESSGAGYHWKNRDADTTDTTNNPRGSTAETTWQRGDVDPGDRDRFDRLYMHQHSMGETTSDTRSRRREQERETIIQQICWNQTQIEIATRLISNESTVGGWNFHHRGNVGMAVGYAFAVAYGNLEDATDAVSEICEDKIPYLSKKEASKAVSYAFSRLEERDISI